MAHGAVQRVVERLRAGTYQFSPMHQRDRAGRRVFVPSRRDTLVQTILLDRLQSHIGAPEHVSSAKGRGTGRGLQLIGRLRRPGTSVFRCDVRCFFDSIPVDRLQETVMELPLDISMRTGILALLKSLARPGLGAGHPLSSALADLYLAPLDGLLSGMDAVRYADDIIVVAECREALLAAKRGIEEVLSDLALQLHPDKTAFFTATESVEFLGVLISPDGSLTVPPEKYGVMAVKLLEATPDDAVEMLVGYHGYYRQVGAPLKPEWVLDCIRKVLEGNEGGVLCSRGGYHGAQEKTLSSTLCRKLISIADQLPKSSEDEDILSYVGGMMEEHVLSPMPSAWGATTHAGRCPPGPDAKIRDWFAVHPDADLTTTVAGWWHLGCLVASHSTHGENPFPASVTDERARQYARARVLLAFLINDRGADPARLAAMPLKVLREVTILTSDDGTMIAQSAQIVIDFLAGRLSGRRLRRVVSGLRRVRTAITRRYLEVCAVKWDHDPRGIRPHLSKARRRANGNGRRVLKEVLDNLQPSEAAYIRALYLKTKQPTHRGAA